VCSLEGRALKGMEDDDIQNDQWFYVVGEEVPI